MKKLKQKEEADKKKAERERQRKIAPGDLMRSETDKFSKFDDEVSFYSLDIFSLSMIF